MDSPPFILLIDRGEADQVAWSRIRRAPAFRWAHTPADLAWFVHCPEDQLVISRCGPVFLAHGGDWARARELECFRWRLVDPLSISGRAVAVRPDHDWGGWRALTEWEAANAEQVLSSLGASVTRSSCRVWEGLELALSGERLCRYARASLEDRRAILLAFARERQQRRLQGLPLWG